MNEEEGAATVLRAGGEAVTPLSPPSPPEAQLGRAVALRPRSSRRPRVSRGPFGRRY